MRRIGYTMVLPDGRPLLFDAAGDRTARIFAFNRILEENAESAYVIRRPRDKDPVPLFRVFRDGTMSRTGEWTDPLEIPLEARVPIARKLVSGVFGDVAVADAELVYKRNVGLVLGDCKKVTEMWCRTGFISLDGDSLNGYALEESEGCNRFRVWTAEEME